jgi:hypothetical protein
MPGSAILQMVKPGSPLADPGMDYVIHMIANGDRGFETTLAAANPEVQFNRMISDVAASMENGVLRMTDSQLLHTQANATNQILGPMYGDQRFWKLAFEEDQNSVVWKKLVLNAAANGPASALQVRMGGLGTTWAPFTRALIEEAHGVVTAPGGAWPAANLPPAATLADAYIDAFSGKYAPHPTSMNFSLHAGSALENDVINGGIVRTGIERRIPTPINDFIYRGVNEMYGARQDSYYPPGGFDGDGAAAFRFANQDLILRLRFQAEQMMEQQKK